MGTCALLASAFVNPAFVSSSSQHLSNDHYAVSTFWAFWPPLKTLTLPTLQISSLAHRNRWRGSFPITSLLLYYTLNYFCVSANQCVPIKQNKDSCRPKKKKKKKKKKFFCPQKKKKKKKKKK